MFDPVTYAISAGRAEPLGASPSGDGVNFAVFSSHADWIEICLFDEADRELARIALPARTGSVFHGLIGGIGMGQRYGIRAHGPDAPERAHRFDPSKLLADPYALQLDRPFRLDAAMFASSRGVDSGPVMPKAVVTAPAPARTTRPATPLSRSIIYEAHARGFSMRHPGISPQLRGRFAALGEKAAIAHFLKLGITAIEVLPIAAWIDERHLGPLNLTNYWGYNPVCFMAPDPKIAPGGWPEIAETVDRLHRAGLEVIIDVVFNHTGEGDDQGPTLSLRGLDNQRYYRTLRMDAARYMDDAGCGNTLRCDDPQVVRLIMDALRAWAIYGGVDGFRFDLAATLGRRESGFDPQAPLFAALLQDPALRELKLIAEPWDIGPGGYQVGSLDAPFADWNDRYRDGMRRFWRGDRDVYGEAATRLSGSSDLFSKRRKPSFGINLIAAHDGFTLADLVSFQGKANLANGEHNRDGSDANNSWNNGAEGPADDPFINERRKRDQRNLLATLLFSLGTPMLLAGSEFGQTQGGNNNAYAQDNETAWLDWARADAGLIAFAAKAISIRKSLAAFQRDRFLSGRPVAGASAPDVSWLRSDGQPMTQADWDAGPRQAIIALFAADNGAGEVQRVLLCLNRGERNMQLALPAVREGHQWRRLIDTASDTIISLKDRARLMVAGRSVMLLAEEPLHR